MTEQKKTTARAVRRHFKGVKQPRAAKGEVTAILEKYTLEAVIGDLESGRSYYQIATALGIKRNALWHWINRDASVSARAEQARIVGAEATENEAERVIRETPIEEIARARELAQHLRWRAKMVDPRRYGDKQTVDVTHRFEEMSDSDLDGMITGLVTQPNPETQH